MNKSHREAITKNNQIFRQRMSTLGAENTQLKTDLEEAQKESAAIAEERDALNAAAATAATATEQPIISEPPTEELERLRQEKIALEQALEEEKAKQPVQAPTPTPAPDTSELESRLVNCFCYHIRTYSDEGCRLLLRRKEIGFSRKRSHGINPPPRRRKPRLSGRMKRSISSRTVMRLFLRPR